MWEERRSKFVAQLKQDFPHFKFRAGRKFMFWPPRTVTYEVGEEQVGQEQAEAVRGLQEPEHNNYYLQMLHELGHAVLGHRSFATDLTRLKMEVAAWERAREFCAKYDIYYDEEFVEGQLDSYRDWLHTKSRCKRCGLTCYQTKDGKYHCPGCDSY